MGDFQTFGLSNFGDSRAHFFEMIAADFYVYFLFLFFVWILCGIFVGREDPIKRAETCCEAKIIKLLYVMAKHESIVTSETLWR